MREYILPDCGAILPDRVRDELTTAFSVEEDREASRVGRTWLDTFDWQLYRAGLTLQHVITQAGRKPRGVGELVLTGTGGQRLTVPAGLVRWPARPRPCRRVRCGTGSRPWPVSGPCCPRSG